MKQKYLILCGASGTGKSYIRKLLTKYAPGFFAKVEQYTTRKIRKGEKETSYIFTDNENFEKVAGSLIGRCTINGNRYGSIPIPMYDTRAGVIILNEEGLDDFIANVDKKKVSYQIVGIHRPLEEALKIRGDERTKEYIAGEYKIYSRCDYVYHNNYETISMQGMIELFKGIYRLLELDSEIDELREDLKLKFVDV